MKHWLFYCLISLCAVALLASACNDDGKNPDAGTDSDSDSDSDSDCSGQACVNDDHNTHTDCCAIADYCFPSIPGAPEHAHVDPLTCTKSNCVAGDDKSCPADYECLEIPPSIVKYAEEEYGAILPATVCGKKDF